MDRDTAIIIAFAILIFLLAMEWREGNQIDHEGPIIPWMEETN